MECLLREEKSLDDKEKNTQIKVLALGLRKK